MASSVKACTNSRYRKTNIVIITILSLLSCFALVMVIYNLIKGSYLFSIAWFIATILASTYVLIRINTVFATYISTDRMNLFMKNWNNDFLPYDYETFEKECYYMPIVKFDTRNVTKIVQMIQRINPELLIRVSSREYRTLRMASK